MASRKGILVVNSAGNNYTDPQWPNIVFPADGDSVLAVGAVDQSGAKASFSAVGPTADGRIKPDVAAFGVGVIATNDGSNFNTVSGTSFSAPLVAGMAAGFWSIDTTMTNIQLRKYLLQSSSIYCVPNNQLGYGVPNFEIAYDLWLNKTEINCNPSSIDYAGWPSSQGVVFPNPFGEVVYFQSHTSLATQSKYAILDVNGKELEEGVLTASYSPQIKIDTSGLKAGVYFLRVGEKLFKLLKL
jgi:subtilisin family serine protease